MFKALVLLQTDKDISAAIAELDTSELVRPARVELPIS